MTKKMVHRTKNIITIDSDSAKRYIELTMKINKLKKELEPLEKQLKTELMDLMEKVDTTNVKSNGVVASLTRAYTQNKFDTTRLKEEDIDTYNKYLKETNVSASLKLSIDK
jgi:predicted phage-related endonuclease